MAYGMDGSFAYDQLFLTPADLYTEFSNTKPINTIPDLDFKETNSKENSKYNVQNYLEETAKKYAIKNFNPDVEELKKKLIEFQHKNDILLIFLIYLIIIIVYQYSMNRSSSSRYPSMQYIYGNPTAPVLLSTATPIIATAPPATPI